MLSPCRVSTIAAAVPALRQIFNRAQHSSPICSAGGPRTVQNPPRRPPRLETGFGPSPSSHPTRSLPASTTRRAPAIISRPKTPQTTSRRLAQLDSPPHERLKSGGPAPVISPRGPRSSPFPLSKPFSPTTYAAPEASADTHSAAPRRFEEFQLHPDLLGPMQERFGVTGKTTAIQTLSLRHFLPSFLGPARVLLGAETGSGKTLAYLLPLFSHLKFTDTRGPSQDEARTLQPRALVLSPTHELTRQSTGMAKALCHVVKLSVMGMSSTKYGGIGDRRGGLDVLCGTGAMTRRMFGLASPRSESKEGEEKRTAYVGVDRLDWVVVDEADVLLGPDFAEEILVILRHILSTRPATNLILCTATLPPSLVHLFNTDPLLSSTPFTQLLSPAMHKLPYNLEARFVPSSGSGNLLADVAHEVRRVLAADAVARKDIMESGTEVDRSKIIVFCNSDLKVKSLSKVLEDRQLPNLAWTGEAAQREHGKNGDLDAFLLDPKTTPSTIPTPKAPSPRILITTSLLSRGLDFSPLVSTVMLVDQPRDILDFLHRAGRTGRAGRKGRVVVFGMGDGTGGGRGMGKQMGEVVGRREKVGTGIERRAGGGGGKGRKRLVQN